MSGTEHFSLRCGFVRTKAALVESKKTTEGYRARAAEIRAVLEWVRRPEYRADLLALIKKYERLAEEAERQSGGDRVPAEAPSKEAPPAPGNAGRASPSLDPMDRKDQ
jgi:hypothetical protein